jgi:hypothetical protein
MDGEVVVASSHNLSIVLAALLFFHKFSTTTPTFLVLLDWA